VLGDRCAATAEERDMRHLGWLWVSLGCAGGEGTTDGFTPYGGTGVEATPYENIPIKPSFQWTEDVYEGKSVQYYVPENPTAALWAFHGTNGGFGTVTQIEWIELYNRLVPFGVAIILNESLDRDAQQWDNGSVDPSVNPDFVRLAAVREYLVATTPLSEATPVLAVGFSNGGGFATRFSNMARTSGWDMRGFSVHNSDSYAGGGVGGIWTSAENDLENGQVSDVDDEAAACTAQSGAECPHLRGTEIPLDPRRFGRLSAYSISKSQEIFDELVDFEYVDADGVRLVPDVGEDIEALMADYISRSRMPSPTLPPTQLRVVWATHRFSSQHINEEADYLLDLL
jgi:hypothetical protein